MDFFFDIKNNYDPTTAGYWAIAIVLFLVYIAPSIIAKLRGKKNFLAIAALNVFLGGTGVGWVIALVWALTHESKND